MIYTRLTNEALKIAYKAHEGQLDKGGIPYIYHPYQVAQSMTDEYSTCVALLHDVAEDTSVTMQELEKVFPREVTEAVAAMTHGKDEPYTQYLLRVKANPIAKVVKLSDIRHNSDPARMPDADPAILERYRQKYETALAVLQE